MPPLADDGFDLYTAVSAHVDHVIADVRERAHRDGLSKSDVLQICFRSAMCAVELIRAVPGMTVEQMRDQVKETVRRIYETRIAPLDLPGIPNSLETAFVDPLLGTVLLTAIDPLFDAFYWHAEA